MQDTSPSNTHNGIPNTRRENTEPTPTIQILIDPDASPDLDLGTPCNVTTIMK